MREERASRGRRGGGSVRRQSSRLHIIQAHPRGLDLDLLVGDRPGAELGRRRRVAPPRAAVERNTSGSRYRRMSLSSLATPSSPSRISRSVPFIVTLHGSPRPGLASSGAERPRPPPRVSCSPTRAYSRTSVFRVTAVAARTCASRTRRVHLDIHHRTACDGSMAVVDDVGARIEWTAPLKGSAAVRSPSAKRRRARAPGARRARGRIGSRRGVARCWLGPGCCGERFGVWGSRVAEVERVTMSCRASCWRAAASIAGDLVTQDRHVTCSTSGSTRSCGTRSNAGARWREGRTAGGARRSRRVALRAWLGGYDGGCDVQVAPPPMTRTPPTPCAPPCPP